MEDRTRSDRGGEQSRGYWFGTTGVPGDIAGDSDNYRQGKDPDQVQRRKGKVTGAGKQ